MAKKLAFDRILFTVIASLVGIGLVMVYSASAPMARAEGRTLNPFLVRQLVSVMVGLGAMFLVMHIDYRRLRDPRVIYTLLIGIIGLLAAVLLIGPELNSTRRWLFFGGVSVQPSELAKLALIPFLAFHLAGKLDRVNSRELLAPVLFVTALLAGLIIFEPDLGTAVLLVVTAGALLFLAGLSWRWLAAGVGLALPAIGLLIYLEPYRRARIFAFLDPERDPLGSGFQAMQSLIAIGSGGFAGLGPGDSIQKLYFLPYPHSDFIFAILAEEAGLLGSLLVVGLFGVLFWRGARAGLKAPDPFGRFLAWGFVSMLTLQALINVSVATALLPTKGIPLPFISYGGSSMVVSLVACGVLLNVSQHDG